MYTFTSKKIHIFFAFYSLEINNASPLCILMPQIIPILKLTLVRTWYDKSNPQDT
jgi:hypothetical protein